MLFEPVKDIQLPELVDTLIEPSLSNDALVRAIAVVLLMAATVRDPPLLLVSVAPLAIAILLANAVCPLLIMAVFPVAMATSVVEFGTVPADQFVGVFQSVLVLPLNVLMADKETNVTLLEALLAALVLPFVQVTVKE